MRPGNHVLEKLFVIEVVFVKENGNSIKYGFSTIDQAIAFLQSQNAAQPGAKVFALDDSLPKNLGDTLFEFEKTEGVQFTNYQRAYLLNRILKVIYAMQAGAGEG